MPSRESISNIGLTRIGIKGNKVGDLTNPINQFEIEVAKVFNITRDAVLRAYPWSFAEKHATLGLLADVDPSNYGYLYAYEYPTDCLKALNIYQIISTAEPIDFKKHSGANLDTLEIWTNQAEAILVYTARVTAIEAWDAAFVHAFTYAIGAAVAQVLTGSLDKEKLALSEYTALLPSAKKHDGKENRDSNRVTKKYIGSRKG